MSGSEQSLIGRLTRAIVLTTAASLVLACAAIVAYDRSTFRTAMTDRAATLAEVVGLNGAVALSFLDVDSATQTLSALEAVEPVIAAVLYDDAGRVFARYMRDARDVSLPELDAPSRQWVAGHVDVRHPVVFGGARIGTIAIRWDTREMNERTLSFVGIAVALLAGSSLVAGILAARLRSQISGPLGELVESSEAIARGDLSWRVRISTHDEIGVLGRTFNTMTGSLSDLVGQVSTGTQDVGEVARHLEESARSLDHQARRQTVAIDDTSESVARLAASIRGVNENVEELDESMRETSSSIAQMQASTTEVASHVDHLASSIETTSSAVGQVAASTDEVVAGLDRLKRATDGAVRSLAQLNRSVERVTENANASQELSEDTSAEAARGLHAVNETTSAMGEISQSFERLQQTISRLAERSASIDDVSKVIQGVADVTGQLALNASIIAAQAGQHGKAFAVVADEVSALARSTHRSTTEISEMIRAVQQDTAEAVSAVEEGASRVERGVQRSAVASEVLTLISEKSRLCADRVGEILEACSLQVADLRSVDGSTGAANEIAERFERSARDQQAATSEIVAAIRSIRDLSQSIRRSMEEQEHGANLIANAASEVATRVTRIAESTHAQTKSSESIEHSLEIFREVTTETTSRAAAIKEMVETLSARAARLESAVGRFGTRPEAGSASAAGPKRS